VLGEQGHLGVEVSTGDVESVLVIDALFKSYPTDGPPVRALRGLDLRLESGGFIALMGPSGCGKSTLLNLIAGLDRPDAGEILLAGVPLVGMSEAELARTRRSHVGFVFQQPTFLGGADALENVEFPALVAGFSKREAHHRAREVLDLLGLLERAREAPGHLSGGERQRLAIARALVHDPTLLLADEPTGALDSAGAAEVLALLGRLHATGQSILLVTHAASVAAGAERTLQMRDGMVAVRTGEEAATTVGG
jgi:putative ABC transport system ATP-binding protein